jgi:hypothetical protein
MRFFLPPICRQYRHSLITLLILGLFGVSPVNSAYYAVTNTDDSGPGSLRQALLDANTVPAGADTIDLTGVAGTITLTSGQLAITDAVTITGPGAGALTISGDSASRIFSIDSSGSSVGISGLTLVDGRAMNSDPVSPSGGAVLNSAGTVTLNDMVIGGSVLGTNLADGSGGGISNLGTLTISNSTISGNVGSTTAGGIRNAGTLTINNSTISGNATDTGGGGIWNSGTLTINNSTIVGNLSDDGGGLYAFSGTADVSNSTISGNFHRSGGDGGALYAASGSIVNLKNTILAESKFEISLVAADNCYQAGAEIQSAGYNLSDDASCTSLSATGDMQSTDAGLDPGGLQDNGGPTKTVALLQASAARAAIPTLTLCSTISGLGVTPDQRGTPRPQGLLCDIGAYELDGGGGSIRMVTSAADGDAGSLRSVLADAGTQADDIVQFDPDLFSSGPVTLTFPRPGGLCGPAKNSRATAVVIEKSVTIEGPGKELLTISGAGGLEDCRVIWVEAGVSTGISGVTIADGQISTQFGANLWNKGRTTLSDCSIVDGHVVSLGGGGGVYNDSTESLTLNNCVVENNVVEGVDSSLHGAGVWNAGSGSLTLVDSTVSGNNGGGYGAGIASFGALTIIGSTINNNTGVWHGGVYKHGASDMTLTNSTISGNSQSDGGYTRGGGLWVEASNKALITNSTIAGNEGYNFIGGLANVFMKNTLLAIAGTQNCLDDLSSNFFYIRTYGHNLADDNTCGFFKKAPDGTDLPDTDPGVLGALQDNGGPTFTHALPEGSAALDAIPPGDCTLVTNSGSQNTPNSVDQRGVARPQGSGCDIGSFELEVIVPTYTVTSSVATGNGMISPSGEQTVDEGSTPEFNLTPDPGYDIDSVSGTCGGGLAGSIFTTDPISTDCTVEANFATICPPGQWRDIPGGTCEPVSTTCPAGTAYSGPATPIADIACEESCVAGTSWNDGTSLTCQAATTCGEGSSEVSPSTVTTDTVCECDEGYEGGSVDGGVYSCTASSCTLPGSLPPGYESGTCVLGSTLDSGQDCSLACSSGYEQIGDLTYACTTGVLTPPAGTCQNLDPLIFMDDFEQ